MLAQRIAARIATDIAVGDYDDTLMAYKVMSPVYRVHGDAKSDGDGDGLLTMLNAYLEANRGRWKENTIEKNRLLIRLIEDSLNGSDMRVEQLSYSILFSLLGQRTRQIRDCMALIARVIGLTHPLSLEIKEGMKSLAKPKWVVDPKPNAFSPDEKRWLLNAIESEWTEGKLLQMAKFVRLMLLTGCRPSEALGLFPSDFVVEGGEMRFIHFQRNVSYRGGKPIFNQGSKNNKTRKFPIDPSGQLAQLAKQLKSQESQSFCFGFNYHNFRQREWKRIVSPIKKGATPYALRDTFITEQVIKGVSPSIIALWCDTSPTVIQKHYLDPNRALSVLPHE
ncbi:MAG: hypothetical protein MH825_08075 [Cyanobacteria bacterium]|nr:hypothetical protein [Cyanobacteriota bacterium]